MAKTVIVAGTSVATNAAVTDAGSVYGNSGKPLPGGPKDTGVYWPPKS